MDSQKWKVFQFYINKRSLFPPNILITLRGPSISAPLVEVLEERQIKITGWRTNRISFILTEPDVLWVFKMGRKFNE